MLEAYTESFLRVDADLTATVTVTAYCLWAFDRTGLLAHAGHQRSSGSSSPWSRSCSRVLHIFRLLDAGLGGEPEGLALKDHVLQVSGCSGSP